MPEPFAPGRGGVAIRPAEASDLPAITSIYNHYVESGAVTFDVEPFTPQQREGWFAQFRAHGPHRLFVATDGDALLGYAGSMPFRTKPAYATSVETTIYLHPDATGRGVGTRLYEVLFDALAGEDLHRVLAGVTLPNDVSITLHERFGFTSVGVFREVGRKHGRYWDVAWFERPLVLGGSPLPLDRARA